MAIRYCKIVLVAMVGFWGLTGVFNLIGWESGLKMVETITSMAEVPGGGELPWATDSAWIVIPGFLFIAGSKLAGGVLCILGGLKMWQARSGPAGEFDRAKSLAVAGCTLMLVLLFGGFMYLSGQFFMGWQTQLGQSATTGAFQLGGSVGLVLLFLNQPDG